MKLTTAVIPQLLNNLKSAKTKAVLFYGPDKGLINHSILEIAKGLDLKIRNISYVEASNMGFDILLNNASLFGKNEVIKITEVPTSIDASFKKLLLSSLYHIPVLIADELAPSTSMRKFFETEDSLASIGCYQDDANAIGRLISDRFREEGKTIEPAAMRYLSGNLGGDRYLVLNEIDKLMLFAHDKIQVTLEDAILSMSGASVSSPDVLCAAFAKGDGKIYFSETAKLLAENVSPVWIIRALIRYFLNLYIVANLKEDGASLEVAMQSLKPPIFFKYVQDFKVASAKHNKASILKVLGLLNQAEIESKSSGSGGDICDGLFFGAWNDKASLTKT